jgi:hypothetical protein
MLWGLMKEKLSARLHNQEQLHQHCKRSQVPFSFAGTPFQNPYLPIRSSKLIQTPLEL